ncbi:hypothetical protein AB4Y32_29405 [Paraburkholderia phymatum]|uniref:Uncharacterized protein n=1 Tax=Paraburkholderia phymatum TaxID=148447 RepID=A0ACC6U8P0_9BURK
MKRLTLICAAGLIAACSSTAALAHVDVGVTFGIPAPVYVEPPPVVYQAPPPVVYQAPPPVVYEAPPPAVYAPAPIYYGYGYRDERRWHDHGRHHGWHHHHDDGDD